MKKIEVYVLTNDELQQLIEQAIMQAFKNAGYKYEGLTEHIDNLLTIDEVATLLSYKARTVKTFITEGRRNRHGEISCLPTVEPSSRGIQIRRSDLEKWVDHFIY